MVLGVQGNKNFGINSVKKIRAKKPRRNREAKIEFSTPRHVKNEKKQSSKAFLDPISFRAVFIFKIAL